ncbi:MAG: dihydroorotase family protein [Candidatus Bathyarchaeia archaeon]
MKAELVVKGKLWVRGSFIEGGLGILDGKVVEIFGEGIIPKDVKICDFSRNLVIPGLVDPHVHLRDMDLYYKEDFFSGTSSAVAGGYTTVLDMPNTVPPTNNSQALEEKRRIAKRKVVCDVGFHLGFNPDPKEITRCLDTGVFSIKIYPNDLRLLYESGTDCVLHLKKSNLPLYVHAEDQDIIEKRRKELGLKVSLSQHAFVRPPEAELVALERALGLFRGFRVHFAHITLADSLNKLTSRDRTAVTFEVTPHHLALTEQTAIKSLAVAKVNPPLRTLSDVKSLRVALDKGEVDIIASDHAPHEISEKESNEYDEVPPGFPSLETSFSLLFTLVSKGYLNFNAIVAAMTERPAKIFNIVNKGMLEKGYDADLFIFDPREWWKVRPELFKSKAKFSPFEGVELKGRVKATYIRGVEVFRDGSMEVSPGYGKILERGRG